MTIQASLTQTMETIKVERWNPKNDGPLSEHNLRRKLEKRGYKVRRYVYPPGMYFPRHAHEEEKIDVVLSGEFRVRIAGTEVVLTMGDALHVPPGAEHTAEVLGRDAVISLDAARHQN